MDLASVSVSLRLRMIIQPFVKLNTFWFSKLTSFLILWHAGKVISFTLLHVFGKVTNSKVIITYVHHNMCIIILIICFRLVFRDGSSSEAPILKSSVTRSLYADTYTIQSSSNHLYMSYTYTKPAKVGNETVEQGNPFSAMIKPQGIVLAENRSCCFNRACESHMRIIICLLVKMHSFLVFNQYQRINLQIFDWENQPPISIWLR